MASPPACTCVNRFVAANRRSNSANGMKAVILLVQQNSCAASEPRHLCHGSKQLKKTKQEGTNNEEVRICDWSREGGDIHICPCRRIDRRDPRLCRTGGRRPARAQPPPRAPTTTSRRRLPRA